MAKSKSNLDVIEDRQASLRERHASVHERRASIVDPANESRELSVWETVKQNPKVLVAAVAMTVGPLIYGFDNIIVGLVTAMPAFQASFGSAYKGGLILPALWLSLWNSLLQVGAMLGSVVNAPIADRFGRKVSFTIGGAVACIAVGIIYVSDQSAALNGRRGTFLAGKIVLGIALGMLNSSCQTYISEIAPARIRGPLLSIFTLFTILGQLIAISIVFAQIAVKAPSAYRVCFAAQWAFAGLAVVVGVLIPESPANLVKRGKLEQAGTAYARLHSRDQAPAAIDALQKTIEAEIWASKQETSTYLDCFRGSNWRRTRIISYANILPQCLGVTLLANSAYFLELGGLNPDKTLTVIQWGFGLSLLANIFSWWSMTRFGRRAIILASTAFVGLLWLAIGVAGCFPGSSKALWFIGITMTMILFFYNCGVGGAYPVIGAETSSVKLRAKSQSIGFLVNAFVSWLFNFTVPYMFDADQGNLGGKCGFIFFALCLIGVVVIFVEVPEMKNRTYIELDEMFESRVPTRTFGRYDMTDSAGREG